MLQRGSIFFSRADTQTDKVEGEYPNGMLDELEKQWGIIKSDNKASYTFAQWQCDQLDVSSYIHNTCIIEFNPQ
jgi:hypothetical protein